jgi:hypothetical protein
MADDKAAQCIKLGQRMRDAQKAFFKHKTEHWLRESKKLEREFDDMTRYVLALNEGKT